MTEELKKKINNHKNLKLLEKNGFCINSYTLKIINYPNFINLNDKKVIELVNREICIYNENNYGVNIEELL